MPAPTYPTLAELTAKLATYVDVDMTSASADAEYVADVSAESQEWLTLTIGTSENLPVGAYTRAFLEVGAQLFRRRRSWGNTDQLDAPATPPVRANPYSAAYPIIAPYLGPVIA